MQARTNHYDPQTLKRLQEAELGMFRDFIRVCEQYHIDYFVIAGTAIGAMREQGMIPWDDDIDVGMLRKDYERFRKIAPKAFRGKYLLNGPDTPRKYYNLVPNLSIPGTRFIVDLAEGNFDIGIFMDIFVFENIPDDPEKAARVIRRCTFWRNLYVLRNIDYFRFMRGEPVQTKARYVLCGLVHRALKLLRVTPNRIYRHYRRNALRYNGKTHSYTILADPFADLCCLTDEDIYPLRRQQFEDFEVCIVSRCEKMLTTRFGDYMTRPPEDQRVNHSPKVLQFADDQENNTCPNSTTTQF